MYCSFTVQRALPWPPNKLSHLTITCKYFNSTTMQRCSTYNCANFARRRDCQSNSHILIGGQFVKKTLFGGHGKARRTVIWSRFEEMILPFVTLERVSIECRKTKTKVITLTNQKGRRQSSKAIKTRSNYT